MKDKNKDNHVDSGEDLESSEEELLDDENVDDDDDDDDDDDLEEKFASVISEINKKYKAAGKLLKEANKIAQKNKVFIGVSNYPEYVNEDNYDDISEYIDTNEVLGELDNAGWSTSSLYC